MSTTENRANGLRWISTARDDIEAARILTENGKHAHACFLCQQAAEKSVKALHYCLDSDPWGHSVKKLIAGLESVDSQAHATLTPYVDDAARLDRFYIPTRYPNGLPELTPAEAYSRDDALAALAAAVAIIAVVGRSTDSPPA